jgi:hypothetical protein
MLRLRESFRLSYMGLDAKERLVEALNISLADDDAHALRERVAQEVPAALASNGQRLSIHYWIEPHAAGVGFATAIEMAAELGEGAQRLYEADLWYPGGALVRQLIECGYLLTLMGENEAEAHAWMTSSHDEIVKRFMPRHMRQRAVRNFRATEYETHCDMGGHPNPVGRTLLRRHVGSQAVSPRLYWVDLAQHLAEVWESFVEALPLYDPRMKSGDTLYNPKRSPEHGEDVAELLSDWREHDSLATRKPEPAIQSSNAN